MNAKLSCVLSILIIILLTAVIVVSSSQVLKWMLIYPENIDTEIVNVYDFSFEEHYDDVLKKVRVEDDENYPFVIKDFNIIMTPEGNLEQMAYYFFYRKNKKYYRSFVEYKKGRNKLTIKSQKIHWWKYHFTMVGAKDFFCVLDEIGVEPLLEKVDPRNIEGLHIQYHGVYTFEEEECKKEATYIYENGLLNRIDGNPSVYKEAFTINGVNLNGESITDRIWVLIDAYSQSSNNT